MQATLYSGTGNLIWVVEVAPGTDVLGNPKWSHLSKTLCKDKGDGLMLVTNALPYHANFFNADGSDGVFCGNGVRCVAYHLVQKYQPMQPFEIIIAGQNIACHVEQDQVCIKLPKNGVESLGENTLQVFPELILSGFRMNMPNPHWVVFKEIDNQELEKIGKRVTDLYESEYGGMNVEFVFKNAQGEWQALVYERGVGITEACGSGAMAVLCVLQNQGLVQVGTILDLRMSGGLLRLQDLATHLSLCGQVKWIREKVTHDASQS